MKPVPAENIRIKDVICGWLVLGAPLVLGRRVPSLVVSALVVLATLVTG